MEIRVTSLPTEAGPWQKKFELKAQKSHHTICPVIRDFYMGKQKEAKKVIDWSKKVKQKNEN